MLLLLLLRHEINMAIAALFLENIAIFGHSKYGDATITISSGTIKNNPPTMDVDGSGRRAQHFSSLTFYKDSTYSNSRILCGEFLRW